MQCHDAQPVLQSTAMQKHHFVCALGMLWVCCWYSPWTQSGVEPLPARVVVFQLSTDLVCEPRILYRLGIETLPRQAPDAPAKLEV